MENTVQFVSVCTATLKPYLLTMTQQSFFAAARTVISIRDVHGAGVRLHFWDPEPDPDFSVNQGKVLKQAGKIPVRDGRVAERESGCIFWIRSGFTS